MDLGNIALSPRLIAGTLLTGISPQLAPGLVVGDFLVVCSDYRGTTKDPYPGPDSAPVALLGNAPVSPVFFQIYAAFWSGNTGGGATVTATMGDGAVVAIRRPVGVNGASGGVTHVTVTPGDSSSDGTYIFRIVRITSVPSNPAQAYSGDIYELGVTTMAGGNGGGDPDPDDPDDPDPGDPGKVSPVDRFRRFLRVNWSAGLGSRLVTRVRFKLGGPGAENAAIALVTGFDDAGPPDPLDVIIPDVPLDADGFVHDIDLPIPQLATGIVFYPDYLLEAEPGSPDVVYPALTLSHLQVYETENEGATQLPLPTVQRSRVGVQEVKIYPHNGSAGPYDATTAGPLYALQELGISKASKSAMVKGGESVHTLGSFEVDRETTIKVSAAQTDLRTLKILLGGDLSVTVAGDGGEIQYFSENLDDRAPYFRLAAKSTNGDGQDAMVFFKCKVDGTISFNLQREQVTNLEFEFKLVWDPTAARQNGKVGGLTDWIFASKGEPTIHS